MTIFASFKSWAKVNFTFNNKRSLPLNSFLKLSNFPKIKLTQFKPVFDLYTTWRFQGAFPDVFSLLNAYLRMYRSNIKTWNVIKTKNVSTAGYIVINCSSNISRASYYLFISFLFCDLLKYVFLSKSLASAHKKTKAL